MKVQQRLFNLDVRKGKSAYAPSRKYYTLLIDYDVCETVAKALFFNHKKKDKKDAGDFIAEGSNYYVYRAVNHSIIGWYLLK